MGRVACVEETHSFQSAHCFDSVGRLRAQVQSWGLALIVVIESCHGSPTVLYLFDSVDRNAGRMLPFSKFEIRVQRLMATFASQSCRRYF
jgi:hypothetical protein